MRGPCLARPTRLLTGLSCPSPCSAWRPLGDSNPCFRREREVKRTLADAIGCF
jgi:hypothetical protein